MYLCVWDTDGSTVLFAYEAEPSGRGLGVVWRKRKPKNKKEPETGKRKREKGKWKIEKKYTRKRQVWEK